MSQRAQMNNDDNRPKWLLELENRKCKQRLAHELGAGAPCLICDVICPGLDLHFWRKICKNCKCSRDDHMISGDEFPQFDLLLGISGKSRPTCVVLNMNGHQIDEETFEWAPPDTTNELAVDYMKALPHEKLPIKGTAGAAQRKQQLQKQLPLHDLEYENCDELSGSEKEQFKRYLKNLKKFVGQGRVSKIVATRPFDLSRITPENASECLTPQRNSRSLASRPPIILRTPSSFVPKLDYSSASSGQPREPLSDVEWSHVSFPDPTNASCQLDNFRTRDPVPSVGGVSDQHSSSDSAQNDLSNMVHSMNMYDNIYYPINDFVPPHRSINDDNRLHEMSDIRGDECIEYDRKMEMVRLHLQDYQVNEVVSVQSHRFTGERLNRSPSNSHFNNSCHSENLPSVPKLHLIRSIDKTHPMTGRDIAKISPPSGESNQPPLRILSGIATQHLDDLSKPSCIDRENLINAPPLHSIQHNTDVVGSSLDGTELSQIRDKLMMKYKVRNESSDYFIGQGCDIAQRIRSSSPSNEQDSCVPSNNLIDFCGNATIMQMHSMNDKNPDIDGIRSEKWNSSAIPDEVAGKSNMRTSEIGFSTNNFPLSLAQEIRFRKCYGCAGKIGAGDVVVTAEKVVDAAWHPGCFVCCTCRELLVDLVYFYHKEKLYCARDLAKLMGIPRCFACDELIFVREYTVAEGHNYHVKHFCCWDCDVPLAGKQYISESHRPLCLHCYQKTYAKLCCACNKIIAADQQGVSVKNLNFHATDQCFYCFKCNKSLLNGRMTVRENRVFCSKECISMFLITNINLC